MRVVRIRPVAVSAASVAVLGLTACGGTPHAGATPANHPAPTARPLPTSTTTHADTGRVALEQAYDRTTTARTAKIAVTMRTTGGDVSTGTGAVRFRPLAERLTLHTGGRTVEAVVVDGAGYVQLPGTGWRRVDLSQLDAAAGQIDPGQVLSYLRGVSSDVRRTGTATIRGTHATGYTATVDLDRAAARQTGRAADGVRRAEKALGTSTLPITVWLDDQGRLVRERSRVALTVAGRTVTSDTTVDLYDYGTPVTVTRPAGA